MRLRRQVGDEQVEFEDWKKEVDRQVQKMAMVSADDLPDKPYWDWWYDGIPPQQAARRALMEEGWPDSEGNIRE